MSERSRLHRDDPSRSGPIRHFANVYQSSAASASTDSDSSTPQHFNGSTAARHSDDSVGGAYRVIEKHINEGRQAAEQINKRPYDGWITNGNAQRLVEEMLRFQAQVLPLWLDALGGLVRTTPSEATSQARANGHATANGTISVGIEIQSSRPVQVTMELREGSAVMPLASLGLHSVDPGKPPVTDVVFTISQAPSSATMRIQIADHQPSGVYSGVIVNQTTGEPRGTLSIKLSP